MKRYPGDPRGGHTRLYWDVQDSPVWRALSWAEQGLWFAIRRKLGKMNNGNIEATLGGSGGLRHHGVTSSASLAKGLRALEAVGLIAKTRQGHLSQGRRVCNLFRFTDEPTEEIPKVGVAKARATNEWRSFKTIEEAKTAIQSAHAAAKTGRKRSAKNVRPVQPVNDVASLGERSHKKLDSAGERGAGAPVRQLKMVKTG